MSDQKNDEPTFKCPDCGSILERDDSVVPPIMKWSKHWGFKCNGFCNIDTVIIDWISLEAKKETRGKSLQELKEGA